MKLTKPSYYDGILELEIMRDIKKCLKKHRIRYEYIDHEIRTLIYCPKVDLSIGVAIDSECVDDPSNDFDGQKGIFIYPRYNARLPWQATGEYKWIQLNNPNYLEAILKLIKEPC